jgi:hypothetical protein
LARPAGLVWSRRVTAFPILKGIYADQYAQLRTSLPVNLEPRVIDTGLSEGQLISSPGITQLATGPGADRGAWVWKGVCYRVMGTKLVSVSGAATVILGDVGAGGPVAFTQSFDRIGINSGNRLYYWNGSALSQVTDPDLGSVIDLQWVDGYFMTTDGDSLVVTELNDPYAVDPLKYGSAEVDPDPIMCLRKVRGEIYALGRYSIENFQNRGGTGFPFTRNPGGYIPKGAVGSRARADFLDSFAFVGGARDEAISVYLAGPGQAAPLANAEIDALLAQLTDEQQAAIEMDTRIEKGEQRLYIHLPDKTLVYFQQASRKNEGAVWQVLAGGTMTDQAWPGRHIVLSAGRWLLGSPAGNVGYLDQSTPTQWGQVAGWRFDTVFLFNEARNFILRAVELIGLPGYAPFGVSPTMFMSTTDDGRTYSQERAISMGRAGDRAKRMESRPCRKFANYAGIRYRGANTALASVMRLEIDVEGLA